MGAVRIRPGKRNAGSRLRWKRQQLIANIQQLRDHCIGTHMAEGELIDKQVNAIMAAKWKLDFAEWLINSSTTYESYDSVPFSSLRSDTGFVHPAVASRIPGTNFNLDIIMKRKEMLASLLLLLTEEKYASIIRHNDNVNNLFFAETAFSENGLNWRKYEIFERIKELDRFYSGTAQTDRLAAEAAEHVTNKVTKQVARPAILMAVLTTTGIAAAVTVPVHNFSNNMVHAAIAGAATYSLFFYPILKAWDWVCTKIQNITKSRSYLKKARHALAKVSATADERLLTICSDAREETARCSSEVETLTGQLMDMAASEVQARAYRLYHARFPPENKTRPN